MRNFIILFLFLLTIACGSKETKKIYVGDTNPKQTNSYQIQEVGKTIGYAHKYEWETLNGEPRHHYFIYDLRGTLVGYIRGDGLTKAYLPKNETKELGNFTLEEASARIFQTEKNIYVFPVSMEDTAVKETAVVVSSPKKTEQEAKPEEAKPEKEVKPEKEAKPEKETKPEQDNKESGEE